MLPQRWKRAGQVLFFVATVAAVTAGALRYRHAAAAPAWCGDCSLTTEVTEKGTLTYRSGTTLGLSNHYLLGQRFLREEATFRLIGRVGKGAVFDERLRGLVSGDRFDRSFAAIPADDRCPVAVSPLYPMALRRFFYALPSRPVFPGQVWRIDFCDGRLSCRYEIDTVRGADFSFAADCAGDLPEGLSVTLSARLSFRADPGLIDRAEATIHVVQGPVDARWNIAERPAAADATDSR